MVYFIGAGSGDPELITVKGKKILEVADVVLYTGSLVPKEVLRWCKRDAIIKNSAKMKYDEIFQILEENRDKIVARVHTGDPTLYSTLAKQIKFLKSKNIDYKIISGVSAVFGAGASLGIEYTITGVSQTLILTRVEGKTPNPESLDNILNCKNSSLVFYLSIQLIDKLVKRALELGYSKDTPCFVVEKATWKDEKIYRGTIETIANMVKDVKGIALILLGEFLNQEERVPSHLYNKD
jgi:precorrin-4/cobalt-precorrin-4 C11-methyltransferase